MIYVNYAIGDAYGYGTERQSFLARKISNTQSFLRAFAQINGSQGWIISHTTEHPGYKTTDSN